MSGLLGCKRCKHLGRVEDEVTTEAFSADVDRARVGDYLELVVLTPCPEEFRGQ